MGASFWVGGLAVAVCAAGFRWMPWGGETFETAQWLALGAVVPVGAASLAYGWPGRIGAGLARRFLAAVFLIGLWFYFWHVYPLFIQASYVVAAVLFLGAWKHERRGAVAAAAFAIVGFLTFNWAFRMDWADHDVPLATRWAWFVMIAATVLGVLALCRRGVRRLPHGPWDLPFVGLLAFTAYRIPVDLNDQHFAVGVTELVRQGGQLLWDVPSQYGFLNFAVAAALPFKTAWISIHVLNSTLIFISSLLVLGFLRALTVGALGVLYSGLLTWAAVLLAPGVYYVLAGPNRIPSTGAFRFIWCYALLAWMLGRWRTHWRPAGEGAERAQLLALPSVLFALGALWSFESAFYCLAIFGPFVVMALIDACRAEGARGLRVASWPVGAPLTAVAVVEVYYRLRFAHAPDWRCLYEYVVYCMGGFSALPMRPGGAVAPLVWAGVLIVAAAAVALPTNPRARWLILPAFGCYWSTASYFVSRSHTNNVLCLAPLWLSCLVLALIAAGPRRRATLDLRAALIPFAVLLMMVTIGNERQIWPLVRDLPRMRMLSVVDRRIPKLNPEQLELASRAGLKASGVSPETPEKDPLLVVFSGSLPTYEMAEPGELPGYAHSRNGRLWLPFAPATQLAILPVERQFVYIERFLERTQGSGGVLREAPELWALEPIARIDPKAPASEPVSLEQKWDPLDPLLNPYSSGLYARLGRWFDVREVARSRWWRLIRLRRKKEYGT